MTFNKQKSSLLHNSYIQFQFNNLQVTQDTYCYLTNFPHQFYKSTYTANTYFLYTNEDINGFTANIVSAHCSNLRLLTLSPTIVVTVFDISSNSVIMLSSSFPFSVTSYFPNSSFTTIAATLSSTMFKTLGFNGQYTILYTFSGIGLVEGFIDLS
jgi:hypothetical protein